MNSHKEPSQTNGDDNSATAAPPTMDDYVRTIIAFAIVFSGLVTIIAIWVYRPIADAQAFSTVMTGLIGGVLGYYFGASGKQKSDSNAQTASEKVERIQSAARKAQARVAEAKGRLKAERAMQGRPSVTAAAAGPSDLPQDGPIHDLEEAEKHFDTI